MASDAPDWQRVVTLISGGSVSDAPDWQRTVTGPGAASVGGYKSLTGAGQTSTPGQLDQAGPFLAVAGNSLINLTDTSFNVGVVGGDIILNNGSAGTSLDLSSTGPITFSTGGPPTFEVNPDTLSVGFYGVTPVGQAGAPATLADVIALLTAVGLCA